MSPPAGENAKPQAAGGRLFSPLRGGLDADSHQVDLGDSLVKGPADDASHAAGSAARCVLGPSYFFRPFVPRWTRDPHLVRLEKESAKYGPLIAPIVKGETKNARTTTGVPGMSFPLGQ